MLGKGAAKLHYTKFLKTVANMDENMIMSAFSVSSVLSMLLTGARGNTFLQIQKALTLDKDFEAVKNGCKKVLGEMKNHKPFCTLKTANRYE